MIAQIRVTYSSVDNFRQTRWFRTLAGARRFAHKWVGQYPDLGTWYAVSSDGIGKVTVRGCTLEELFPQPGVQP